MANVAPHILKPFVKQVGDGHLGRRDQPFVPVLERLPELPAYFRLGLGVEVAGIALGVFVDGASSSVRAGHENAAFTHVLCPLLCQERKNQSNHRVNSGVPYVL